MKSDIRHYWTEPHIIRVTTPKGPGRLLDIPLEVQIVRGRIGVLIDGWTGKVQYFNVEEIEGLPKEVDHAEGH